MEQNMTFIGANHAAYSNSPYFLSIICCYSLEIFAKRSNFPS